jgi:hypothetical protein
MNAHYFRCVQMPEYYNSVIYLRVVLPASSGAPAAVSCTDGKGKVTLTMSGAVCAMKRISTMRMRLIS